MSARAIGRAMAALAAAGLLAACQTIIADDTDAPLQPTLTYELRETLEARTAPPAIVAPPEQIIGPTAAPAATAEGTGAP